MEAPRGLGTVSRVAVTSSAMVRDSLVMGTSWDLSLEELALELAAA